MKKQFKNYAVMWSIALIIFSAVVFLVPDNNDKYTKYGGAFWAGYILIFLAFIGQLIVSKIFFKEENKDKVFLNLRMFSLSVTCLILSLIFGTALMLIPDYPQWLGAIIVFVLLGFYTIAVFASKSAADAVSDIGERTKAKTGFIKVLTAEAESLASRAKSDEAKIMVNKVYEALRYSNKSSNGYVAEIEQSIASCYGEFADAVLADDKELIKSSGEQLVELIGERDVHTKYNK